MTAERENGVGLREKMAWVGERRWRGLRLTVGLNQHLSIFGDVNQIEQ